MPSNQINYKKEWYLKNRERILKSRKEYAEKNNDKIVEYQKNYKENNKEKLSKYKKEWHENNKTRRLLKMKEYSKLNRNSINKYMKDKFKKDILYKLSCLMRGNINRVIKQKLDNKSKSCEILGCSFKEFKSYIESKFEYWMTWENHGKYNGELDYGWDIDHIVPLSSAKSVDDVIRLNHYTNLQPLCSKNNRYIKRGKINE